MSRLDAQLQIERTTIILEVEHGAADILSSKGGMNSANAQRMARRFAEWMASMFAGTNMVIPLDYHYMRRRLAEAVMSDFNGTNHSLLVRKYGVPLGKVYEIIRNHKKRRGELPERAEFMKVAVETITHLLTQEYGFAHSRAEQIGHEVADFIAEKVGGLGVCFPSDYSLELARRDVALLRDFDGRNQEALAEQHSLPLDDVHEILGGYRNLPLMAPA